MIKDNKFTGKPLDEDDVFGHVKNLMPIMKPFIDKAKVDPDLHASDLDVKKIKRTWAGWSLQYFYIPCKTGTLCFCFEHDRLMRYETWELKNVRFKFKITKKVFFKDGKEVN